MTPLPKPTRSRIVDYSTSGSPDGKYVPEPIPAIIVRAHDDNSCDLTLFNPIGTLHPSKVPYSEWPKAGHWSWPEHMRTAAGVQPPKPREFPVDDRIQVLDCENPKIGFKWVRTAYSTEAGDSYGQPGPGVPRKGDIIIDEAGFRWQVDKDPQLSVPPSPPFWGSHLTVEGGEEWFPGYPTKNPD